MNADPMLDRTPGARPAAREASWRPTRDWRRVRRRLAFLVPCDVALSIWYFSWLLEPSRVGSPALYGLLVAAEVFNLLQAAGFWWTASAATRPRATPPPWHGPGATDAALAPAPGARHPAAGADILVPVYDEDLGVVAATVAAARRVRGDDVSVVVCDDGDRDELAALAADLGARYLRRDGNEGAKAGNLNHALRHTDAPLVAVFDCDHIPDPSFLEATLGHFHDPGVALVQTPQYYRNTASSPVAAAAASQQALFFGIIARGKDAMDSMFCCGTNVVYRRAALEAVGGIPERSVTEDFELSIRLREAGWRTAYVPEVLAQGLGPEDMASYVSQQRRWARGCLAAIASAAKARLPLRQRLQFFLSSMFFLTGWTYLVYMALPVIRITAGQQALAGATADQFLAHFAPYFGASMLTVAVGGAGAYSFAAFALMEATFWVHIGATLRTVTRRRSRFVVTPKVGRAGRQPLAVAPALLALLALVGAGADGLAHDTSPATLNNVAFAALHVVVLLAGTWPALTGTRRGDVAATGAQLERAAA